jgi:hypothetical protein
MSEELPAEIAPTSRLLTAAEFHRLADLPPEVDRHRPSSGRSALLAACGWSGSGWQRKFWPGGLDQLTSSSVKSASENLKIRRHAAAHSVGLNLSKLYAPNFLGHTLGQSSKLKSPNLLVRCEPSVRVREAASKSATVVAKMAATENSHSKTRTLAL